jgi:hypothetical protein
VYCASLYWPGNVVGAGVILMNQGW